MPDKTGPARPRGLNLFYVSLPFCAAIAAWGIADPDSLGESTEALTSTSFRALDWFFMLSVSAFVILALWLAFGKYGKLKLGRPEDEPEFSTASWIAMLFSAGMGVGLLFWGVAEPLTHFMHPPVGEAGTVESARQAMNITNFHWGLHAWACYGIGALVLAYFGFRRGTPYLAGAPIRSVFSGRWVGPVAYAADLIAILAVAFGVAGSIGMGIFQLKTGLHVVAGTPNDASWVPWAILVVLVISYMTSAATSLDKGIKWLSNINMVLALLLLGFMLFAGPTPFLLRTVVTSLSDYIAALPQMSLQMHPYQGEAVEGWLHGWTLTYFIWWIAWAPFVGIFIARISKGRTIREFILGVLFAPTLFSIIWFGVFGGTGFYEDLFGAGGVGQMVQENLTVALFSLFDRLPMSGVLGVVTLFLLFVFLVTSVDSATFVLGMLTSKGSLNPPTSRKIGWGLILGALGAALMLSGNIYAVRAAAVSGAIPFVFILLIQVSALFKALAADTAAGETVDQPPPKTRRSRSALSQIPDGPATTEVPPPDMAVPGKEGGL
ncbi:MAG: BCCT family transporter [Bradymonadia bacterium]